MKKLLLFGIVGSVLIAIVAAQNGPPGPANPGGGGPIIISKPGAVFASQAEANAGVIPDKSISPATLAGYSLAQATGSISAATATNIANAISSTNSTTGNAATATYVTTPGLTNSVRATNILGNTSPGTNVFSGPKLQPEWNGGPRLGFGTYLMHITNGSGQALCAATEYNITNEFAYMDAEGVSKLYGRPWVWIDEGYQSGTVFGTINTTAYPGGMTNFVKEIHAMGKMVGLYSDLSYLTCCGLWGCGGTNMAAAAALFESWGIDHLRLDTCNYTTLGITWNETVRRAQYEQMAYELRKIGSKITIEMHMNATPYAAWIGENMNSWQIAPNGDGGYWWAQLKAIDQAALCTPQFRKNHTPKIAFGNPFMMSSNTNAASGWTNSDGTYLNYGNGYYSLPLLGISLASMWHSDWQLPGDPVKEQERWINAGFPTVTWGAELVTNYYLLRMEFDTKYQAPTKIATNGTVEAWATTWDDNRIFLMLVNRGYNGTHYYTNFYDGSTEIGIPVTATSITIPITTFGFRTNELATATDIIAYTNKTSTTSFTFTVPTNGCFSYVISAPQAKEFTGRFVGDGTGLTGISGSQTPWNANIDGNNKVVTSVKTIGFTDEITNSVFKIGGISGSYVGIQGGNSAVSFALASLITDGTGTIINGPGATAPISFKQNNNQRFYMNTVGDIEAQGPYGLTNWSYLTVTGRINSATFTNTGAAKSGSFVLGTGSIDSWDDVTNFFAQASGNGFPLSADGNGNGKSITNLSSVTATNFYIQNLYPTNTFMTVPTVDSIQFRTNLWTTNTIVGLGTNYTAFCSVNTSGGITGVGGSTAISNEMSGQLVIKCTGDITFTNPVAFYAADGVDTRTFTNGNLYTVLVHVIPGFSTNLIYSWSK